MSIWVRQVLPRVIDRCCGVPALQDVRARVCAGLSGDVLEIGFGSGLNVPHYPPAVRRVLAVEPSDVAMRMAADRLAATPVPVERVGLDGAALPLPDAAVDAALSTWTLCTIPDVTAALVELRRVLRPGGRFHFVEHGRSAEPGVARWQARLAPLNARVAGGCRIDRPIEALLTGAGFSVQRLETAYAPVGAKPWAYLYEGVAAAPG